MFRVFLIYWSVNYELQKCFFEQIKTQIFYFLFFYGVTFKARWMKHARTNMKKVKVKNVENEKTNKKIIILKSLLVS